MTEMVGVPPKRPGWIGFVGRNAALIFSLTTMIATVAILLAPLDQIVGPAIVVFIPTLLAAVLIRLTEGKGQVRARLFSRAAWRFSWKWAAIGLGVGAGLRVGVSALGLASGYPFQPGAFVPFLLVTFIFAAAEEIGWRGFALPRLLEEGRSPLTAALLLGIPWAALHLPLVLPGKLSAGTPPLAQFVMMLSLSVLVTWAYLGSGGSLVAPTLLHGAQNALVILNYDLPTEIAAWMAAAVYLSAALLVILLTRGRLGFKSPRPASR